MKGSTFRGSHVMLVVALAVCALSASPAFAVLPEGRTYEMVSPVGHGGYGIGALTLATMGADEGERVGLGSEGVFAGSQASLESGNGYLATRGPNEWSTSAIDPPVTLAPQSAPEAHEVTGREAPEDWSPLNLSSVDPVEFSASRTTLTRSALVVYRREPDGALVEASPVLRGGASAVFETNVATASVDLRHVLLHVNTFALAPVVPDDTMQARRLYEVDGPGDPAKLVGVNNAGGVIDPTCEVTLGSRGVGSFHAMSADGSEVFFTTGVEPLGGKCDEPGSTTDGVHNSANPVQLFARVDGSKTIEISKPISEAQVCGEKVPCPGAKSHASVLFQGANIDGSKVFFTTTQSLVSEDEDTTNDLYMATISNGAVSKLVLVSEGDSTDAKRGQGAEVQGVTRVSDDGSHVFFVARGVLSSSENGLGQGAVAGADNLYAYDTVTQTTKFVAELCSGHEASGSTVGVTQCPGAGSDEALWQVEDQRPAQANGCREESAGCEAGRFLVFDTYAQLVRSGAEADADSSRDVYRYNAQTGEIMRVSVGEHGYDADGNGSFDATLASPPFQIASLRSQYEMDTRAVTEDGSNGGVHDVRAALAACLQRSTRHLRVARRSGRSDLERELARTGDAEPVITLSGRDIVFLSEQALVPQDVNGLFDVYDARIGGGFPVPPALAGGCSGAACQGPPSVPSLLAAPSSATFSGLGNKPASVASSKPAVKTKQRTKKHKRKPRRSKKARNAIRARRAQRGRK